MRFRVILKSKTLLLFPVNSKTFKKKSPTVTFQPSGSLPVYFINVSTRSKTISGYCPARRLSQLFLLFLLF
ncbi:MAG TPA: hypothetical protein DHW42_09375 [Candidatus Marinimicrobia bacterium]|nr:hypothetical protein [Candidatus Neomarinimicrobiota bacterium]